jgi:APA family basic amino acid/polyamine antiporter
VQSQARASSPDTSDRDGPLVASNRAPSAARPALPSLERRLGPLDAAAVIVSNVIGGGILFTAPQVAASVPDAWWFLFTWLAGGLLALSGAMAYAELAALRPRAGGEYVYLHAAFGPLAAFLTGWTSFVAGFSGAIAVSAVVFADYLGRFAPLAADRTALVSIPLPAVPLTISAHSLTAILVIVALSWIHFRGVGPGRVVGNLLASLKVSALVLFVVLGVSLGVGSTEHFVPQFTVPAGGWLLALVPVMFTYSGWNAASYVAEEIRDPGRNVPRALALGTGAVIAIYLALNAVYVYVFPMQTLAGLRGSVLDRVADRLLGAAAGDVMGIVAIISLAASISAMVFAGPRVYYAMARDGLFFPHASGVNRGPGGVEHCPGALRESRRPRELHRVCRRVVLRHRRCGLVRAALAPPGREAAVSGVGISSSPGRVRPRQRAHRPERNLAKPATFGGGRGDHPRGVAVVLVFEEATPGLNSRRYIRRYVPALHSGVTVLAARRDT